MSALEHRDTTADRQELSSDSSHPVLQTEAHNSSPQFGVVRNNDPVLDIAREHHHAHTQHAASALKGRDNEMDYSAGTTDEPQTIPHQDAMDNALHRRHIGGGEKSDVGIHDMEKGGLSPVHSEVDPKSHRMGKYRPKIRVVVHLAFFLLFTGWWIASLILHRYDKNWIIPFLLWLVITIRLVTFYVPIAIVTKPLQFCWNNSAVKLTNMIPEKMRVWFGAVGTIAVIIIGAFASPESSDNTRANRAVSLFGLAVFITVLYGTSHNRRMIKWHTVIVGMLAQFLIALFVLRTSVGYNIFSFISSLATLLLGFANDGLAFLTSTDVTKLPWFFTGVIPAIIFFVAFVQLLYYFGFIQWFIGKFAVLFFWSMRVSGAEAVVAAASPFIGQGESAMLIKPFVAHLTQAELHQIMCSGFATIAGSVLIAYIHLGINAQALVSCCVMSIPASLAISKLRYPEEEETLTAGRVVIPDDDQDRAANALHAFANGAWLGLKIGGMIIATLLCIIALLGLCDGFLGWWGYYINVGANGGEPLSIEMIVGYLCYPIAFLLGVPRNGDLYLVGRLIGTKLIANEFVAYSDMQTLPMYANLLPRSRLIVSYALCGFANIGSLGTQIGVLSQIAPGRAGDVSRLAVSALLAGAISTLTSASIAGMLVTDQVVGLAPSTNSTLLRI